MADLSKQNARVVQFNCVYTYGEDGTAVLHSISAHVTYDIVDGEAPLTTHSQPVSVELSDEDRVVIERLIEQAKTTALS